MDYYLVCLLARPTLFLMNFDYFNSFCEMMDTLPAGSALKFAQEERQMIEDDFVERRTNLGEEELSVLNFCRFLEATAARRNIPPCIVPLEHVELYRKIVQKLVATGELLPFAPAYFETVFTPVLALAA